MSRGTERMKIMTKSSSIKLSDLEALRSPPTRMSLSQSRKPTPLHFPTTAASPQKPLVRRIPNYMKPTRSSAAKMELLPARLRNTRKNRPQKRSRISQSSSVYNKKSAKTLLRSSSVNLVRTLASTPTFEASKACPKKSTTAVLRADNNALGRTTCSSALKDAMFPAHHILNPGSAESEGDSIMKVCPYIYCSLNGNFPSPSPQFYCNTSARRSLLNTHKNIKLEAPQRLRKNFDGIPVCDEAHRGNRIITPLIREIGMDFFIEVSAKERKADKIQRFDDVKHLECEEEEGIKYAIEGDDEAVEEESVKQVSPCVPCDLPKSEINPKEDFNINFDATAIEADTMDYFHEGPDAKDAYESHPPSWFHEEICIGNYCSEVANDWEYVKNIEMGDSDSKGADMEWEGTQFFPVNHNEDVGSSANLQEEADSKLKSFSECSCDITEIRLDNILSNHYTDIMFEKASQQAKEEKSTCVEAKPCNTKSVQESTGEIIDIKFKTRQIDYPYSSIGYEYDQSSLADEVFQYLTNTEDNERETEKHMDNEASCASMVLDEDTVETSEGHKICETPKIEKSREDSNTKLENHDVPEESTTVVQDQELVEEKQVRARKFQTKSCIGGKGQNTNNNWQWLAKHKLPEQDVEEMGKITPRKPDFLPLVPEPEPEKVELKHQMMEDRKNSEEWMLDFSLRQAVTKIAPAGKKKVALLVEAFETVMSAPKCETRVRNNSPFAHTRPIQACR